MPLEVGRLYIEARRVDALSIGAVLILDSIEDGMGQFNMYSGTCEYNNGSDGQAGIYLPNSDVELYEGAVQNTPHMHASEWVTVNTAPSYTTMWIDDPILSKKVKRGPSREDLLLADVPKEWTSTNLVPNYDEIVRFIEYVVVDDGPRIEHKTWQEREASNFCTSKSRELNIKLNDSTKHRQPILFSYRYTGDETEEPMYVKLPDNVLEYLASIKATPPEEHFIHVSRYNKSQVAYVQSPEHGERDRQTSVKFGKYLRQHFDHLTDPEVAEAASLYRKEMIGDIDVKFARTRAEIREVYEEGPDSCMSHNASSYMTQGVHPCEIYATPDCSIAYVERDGRITGRTVINEVQKNYVRIYGDEMVLQEGLDMLGYKQGSLNGCSLLLLRTDSDQVVAPYLDGECTTVDVLSDKIVVNFDGDEEMQGQYGTMAQEVQQCGHCDDAFHEEDICWSGYHDIYICDGCSDEYTYAYYSDYGNQSYIRNDRSFYEYEGEYYTSDSLDYHNLIIIDDTAYRNDDSSVIYSHQDEQWYLTDDVEYFQNIHGDMDCTCIEDLIQPEDVEHHMLAEDCYDFQGLYYRYEDNKQEAEDEHNQKCEEESKEVA